MNLYPLTLIPEMPSDATGMLYFWYMVPYAIPGFITFFVGVSLCLLGLFRTLRKERIGYYLSFSGTCLGFGILGLVLALRAVIRDEAILLDWNSYLYPIVLLLAPSSYQMVYYILEKKYKILFWAAMINWITTLIAFIGILNGVAFTGEFLHYSFGMYPVASVYLKPWGIAAAIGYFLFGIPAYIKYLRKNSFREKRYLVIGHNLLLLLVISNLPSFVGIPIFPGSTFSFIPMLILAYGVFNSDFRDLKQLLFEKSGLFYILNVFVGMVLLVLAGSVLFLFSPLDYEKLNWYPWLLIPLLSVFAVVGLGIFIGGTNPNKPLNQLGAFSLYLYGFQLLAIIALNLTSSPLIGGRIEQLCYVIFCFAPSIQSRFAFLSIIRPLPKVILLIDIASVFMSAMALSPYFFYGYFEFPWGRFSASGPAIQAFGAIGFISISIGLREWWLSRKSGLPNYLGDFAALYLSLGGLMLLCNLPATMGIEFYPVGNLSIVPTGILAFAVMRYGGDIIKTEASRLSSYLLPFAVLPILLLILVVWNTLPKEASTSSHYLHLLLTGIPLMLIGFLVTFILIRPIAAKIDRTVQNLEKQKEISEQQKKEIEDLNQFTHLVNSLSNLNDIFLEISKYVYNNHNIVGTWLFLPDENKEYLFAFKVYSYIKLPLEKYNYLLHLKLPMKEKEGGMLYKNFQRKKPFYLEKISKFELEFGIDKEIIETLLLKSLLHIPLVRKEECVGILAFSNVEKEMKLTKNEIRKISNLCSQITGTIDTNHLLKQVETARKQAVIAKVDAEIERGVSIIARMESEKQKEETEDLNKLIKSLNEEIDLKVIMQKIIKYINNNYGIQHYALYKVNQEKTHISLLDAHFPSFANEETRKTIFNFQIPVIGNGAHGVTFKVKRPFFPSKIRRSSVTKEELFVIDNLQIEAFLMIPLILQNEPIGIIDFFNEGKMNLSKEDITRLSILCEQLTGIIHGSNLFKQVQDEKEKALVAQQETEKQKQETEALNKLIKSLNEDLDIKTIMKKVHKYIKKNYNVDYYGLSVVEKDKERIVSIDSQIPHFVSNSDKERINCYSTKVNEKLGAHAFAFKSKKAIFFSRIRKSAMTSEELFNQEATKLESILIIPLILQNDPIGFLDLFNVGKMELSKEDITKLSILGEQLAGIVYGSNLFKEVQEAKEQAEIEKGVAQVAQTETEKERQKSEKLLLNILPKDVATELKENGFAEPVLFESVSVMFTDFKGFTQIAETLTPTELLKELDACFIQFDKITERHNLEKLKTIGDSYMCAGGIPKINSTNAIDCVLAALEIQAFMLKMKELKEMQGFPFWELRLGIHSGSLVAGVIGERKFAYDVWGDTVNTASRMESSGTPGKINISGVTYELVKEFFDCEFRGMVKAKNKGEIAMYYVNGIKKEWTIADLEI